MPRQLTLAAVREAQKEHGSDPFLVLLTLEIESSGEYIYIVNNTENILSRGVDFIGCPFSIALPDVSDYMISDATLTVDNVDTRIWKGVRMLDSAPWVTLEVVLASAPDDVVFTATGFRLREASATSQSIVGKMVPDTLWQGGFPEGDFDPSQNPGMFTT